MTTIDYGPDVATLRAQLAEARAEIGRLTAERDARPAITPSDAAHFTRVIDGETDYEPSDIAAEARVFAAIRAHAKGGE